ncbi:MAG: alpha/beta fold hydrolase [Candidatus Thiodiazotropha sp.]
MSVYRCKAKLASRDTQPIAIRRLLLLLIVCLAESTSAANLSRELRIAEALAAGVTEGTPVWLEADSVRFLALHNQTPAPERLGGVILLHDSGNHADWHEVIQPLRRHLSARGWDTLSIQSPLSADPSDPAGNSSLIALSTPRIRAGVDFLNSQQINDTVLIGHGLGAEMALNFVTRAGDGVRALVAIGVTLDAEDEEDPFTQAMTGTEIPILDIFGSLDHPAVIASATLRRGSAIRNGRDRFRQDRVAGADHYFSGMQDELSHRIAAWLKRTAGLWQTRQSPSAP